MDQEHRDQEHRARLTQAWCRWYDQQDPSDAWAEEEVMIGIVACKLSTDDAWDVILGLLAAAPNENVLGNVGASPLEDLLNRDPEAVAALIEREAPNNERLRRALHHTWRMNTPEEIFARVKSFAQQP